MIETDYLIVGSGAAGMAIGDELLSHTDAHITIIDRRHAPGGHWVDAYPFVRLHQPSSFYGVSSVPLGEESIDEVGTNAGFYELAGATELCAYYERVLQRRFLPSGRVTYLPCCEYLGDHRAKSRLGGKLYDFKVRRKVVDTTYLEGSIPATSPPPFDVSPQALCVPAGGVARLSEQPDRYVIIGAGKTALDVCVWLLEQQVPASSITWIKPREAWWLNRKYQQPGTLLPNLYLGSALQLEAMAQAQSLDDLVARLESSDVFLRVDQKVKPTMLRGAVISERELALLRQIEDVVRLGHVQKISGTEIVLDEGTISTTPSTVHVHCAAQGLANVPVKPIFSPGMITPQRFQWGFACFQFAMLGVMEATIESDDAKNELTVPVRSWDSNADFLHAYLRTMAISRDKSSHAELAAWSKTTRLGAAHELRKHRDNPQMQDALQRIREAAPAAAKNAIGILAASQ